MRTAILSYARTPIGGLLGALSSQSAVELGGHAIRAALARSESAHRFAPDGVIMGCVLPAGLGQAPARQASFRAGLSDAVPASTVNKMCGSGLQAVIFAHQTIASDSARFMVAGGMESMSNAPHLVALRRGQKFGHASLVDSMQKDGLEDAYTVGKPMGAFADEAARAFGISRERADDYAYESLQRAQSSQAADGFADEITEVSIEGREGSVRVSQDEQPSKARPDAISRLRPVFSSDGIVTAANASSISDGAAAVVLAQEHLVREFGIEPLAWMVGHSVYAGAPGEFCSAPVGAIGKLLSSLKWKIDDVSLFEINEAFAVVPLIAMKELGIGHDKLNVRGGACALGHPIGASGARILVTLISALRERGGGRGVCAICLGGGEALAVAVEV